MYYLFRERQSVVASEDITEDSTVVAASESSVIPDNVNIFLWTCLNSAINWLCWSGCIKVVIVFGGFFVVVVGLFEFEFPAKCVVVGEFLTIDFIGSGLPSALRFNSLWMAFASPPKKWNNKTWAKIRDSTSI